VRKAGEGDRKSGTTVRVWPDAKYFEALALPMAQLTHLLRSKAVLMPGVTRVDGRRVEIQAADMPGAYRATRAAITIANR